MPLHVHAALHSALSRMKLASPRRSEQVVREAISWTMAHSHQESFPSIYPFSLVYQRTSAHYWLVYPEICSSAQGRGRQVEACPQVPGIYQLPCYSAH